MAVDVHIIRTEGERSDWYDQCIQSLAGEPAVIHHVEGTLGHVGVGRKLGFSMGEEPFVACVDPDDVVVPGALQACIDVLENDPKKDVAYTREGLMLESGVLFTETPSAAYSRFVGKKGEIFQSHHLCVYRRAAMPPLSFLLYFPIAECFEIKKRMWNESNFAFVDMVGYYHRHYKKKAELAISMENLPPGCKELLAERIEVLFGGHHGL